MSVSYPTQMIIAHGVIMPVSIILLLPIGALTIQVAPPRRHLVRMHGAWQLFALGSLTVGFAIGFHMAGLLNLVRYKPLRQTGEQWCLT